MSNNSFLKMFIEGFYKKLDQKPRTSQPAGDEFEIKMISASKTSIQYRIG